MARRTIKHPAADSQWKSAFRGVTMRTNFQLYLSQAMIEFLCATADDVHWDRSAMMGNIHCPDNFIATGRALHKRGLVERKSADECAEILARWEKDHREGKRHEHSFWRLTPAGEALVELFKVTGIFVEADAAISKRSRKRG